MLSIVALDDGLGLLLYGFASSIAVLLTGTGQSPIWSAILMPVCEILGSIVLGILTGVSLSLIVKLIKEEYEKTLTFTIASVILVIGLSIALKLDTILASMALGVTIANFSRQKNRILSSLLKSLHHRFMFCSLFWPGPI
ncbi:MAG: hypothetical protein GWN61_20095 [candidate division Zixibacteria bacterium]|nr:hypothetical protein [Phycisphaerae bacterium]NIR66613.1 hypothetical protein [candidate division Zixibacteria bacterium]NIS48174.1 hypothetical protein [candidate division Zixibacteria bacterium]NIU16290.1 hypothetical protein [candidate division Zixibacteria bacterium]NIV08415.1 hypothetical protein [candidate division Zixibacteria bacterium]